MNAQAIFLTHAEAVIDPVVPVPEWRLSDLGRARHTRFAQSGTCANVGTLFCSAERKARDGAALTATAIGVAPRIRPALGENDRSATGYLPKEEFERVADAFFAHPDETIQGWETARDAQTRIVKALKSVLAEKRPEGDVLIVSHGAVAALLRCHLLNCKITRDEDQPGNGGGWFAFDTDLETKPTDWNVI